MKVIHIELTFLCSIVLINQNYPMKTKLEKQKIPLNKPQNLSLTNLYSLYELGIGILALPLTKKWPIKKNNESQEYKNELYAKINEIIEQMKKVEPFYEENKKKSKDLYQKKAINNLEYKDFKKYAKNYKNDLHEELRKEIKTISTTWINMCKNEYLAQINTAPTNFNNNQSIELDPVTVSKQNMKITQENSHNGSLDDLSFDNYYFDNVDNDIDNLFNISPWSNENIKPFEKK